MKYSDIDELQLTNIIETIKSKEPISPDWEWFCRWEWKDFSEWSQLNEI